MERCLEHPAITRTLRTGYPYPLRDGSACAFCGEPIDGKTYEIDCGEACIPCFIEWVNDYLITNPDDVAKALNVPIHGRV